MAWHVRVVTTKSNASSPPSTVIVSRYFRTKSSAEREAKLWRNAGAGRVVKVTVTKTDRFLMVSDLRRE